MGLLVAFWGAVVLAALLSLFRIYGQYQSEIEKINFDIEWWIAYHEQIPIEKRIDE